MTMPLNLEKKLRVGDKLLIMSQVKMRSKLVEPVTEQLDDFFFLEFLVVHSSPSRKSWYAGGGDIGIQNNAA